MDSVNEVITPREDVGMDKLAGELTAIEQQIAAAMTQYLNAECVEYRRLASLQQQVSPMDPKAPCY